MRTEERDVVLFLGAGFSADADLPVMRRFGETARVERFQLAKDSRTAAKELAGAGKTYESFRKLCLDTKALSRDDADNIELVFSIAEALTHAGHESLRVNGQDLTCSDVVSALQMWIWKVYHQLPFFNERNRSPKRETYRRFFDLLINSGVAERTTVITTNYDICFEWLAWERGLCCSYPISPTPQFTVSTNMGRFISPGPPERTVIPVCKLHGSVNYFVDPESPHEALIAADISDGRRFLQTRTKKNQPAVMYVEALASLRKRSGKPLTPAIVPPTYAKLGHAPWMDPIWLEALNALRKARHVIFVGYSMPRSDGFMRALLQGALVTREVDAPPQFHVIDGCQEAHDRFNEAFDNLVVSTPFHYLAEANLAILPEIFTQIGGE